MQIYTITFPITDKLTQDLLIELVIEWNQGSPHNKMTNLNWDGTNHNIRFEEGSRSLAFEEIRAFNTLAVRFRHVDQTHVIYTTDIVVNFDTNMFTMRLDRETTVNTNGFVPKFKVPILVNMMMERGYVGMDGELEISDQPMIINEENCGIIEDIICKRKNLQMPVIYLTKYWGEIPCRAEELAYRLRGAAHVLVEDSVEVSRLLRERCEGRNAHHGSIGIYYPGHSTSPKIIVPKGYQGRETMLIDRIEAIVCWYANQQERDYRMTWEGVQNELLRLRYASATEKKNQAEQEVEDLYKSVDGELKEKDRMIEERDRTIKELNSRIMALQAENQWMHAKYDQESDVPLLYYGFEQDLYEGEIQDVVLESLKNQLKNVQRKSRKEHIIRDLLDNNAPQRIEFGQKEEIKRILKGYTKFNNSLARELRGFGFTISKDGGHYKLTYKDDPRYMFTIAASGSDSQHGGGNLASEIIGTIF